MGKYNHIENEEILEKKLNTIVKEVQELENPHVITEYKHFFKKHVNIFRRNFVAAYIIKKFLTSNRQQPSIAKETKHNNHHDKKNTGTESVQRHKKIIFKNVSQEHCNEKELLAYLLSLKGVTQKDIANIIFQDKKSIIHVNPKAIKQLINGVRSTTFKNKKVYYSY